MFTSLSDEQRQFIGTVRDLAQSEFRARALDYMNGAFPWDNMRRLAELGVLGMAVPEDYGGLGLPVFDTALVLEEIAPGLSPEDVQKATAAKLIISPRLKQMQA